MHMVLSGRDQIFLIKSISDRSQRIRGSNLEQSAECAYHSGRWETKVTGDSRMIMAHRIFFILKATFESTSAIFKEAFIKK